MENINVIHVVETSERIEWLESLSDSFDKNGIRQIVISINNGGTAESFFLNSNVKYRSSRSTLTLVKIFQSVVNIRRANSKGVRNLVLAHGHLPSMVALLSRFFWRQEFGVVHHQPPLRYFLDKKFGSLSKRLIHSIFYICYLRNAIFIQALSLDVVATLTRLKISKSRIHRIGHGVDFNKFHMQMNLADSSQDLFEGFPRFLMVGRLTWEKNYLLALDVVQELKKVFPNLSLLVAGTGPQKLVLEQELIRRSLSEQVHLLGWVENIPSLMKSSDAFIHLSSVESYGQAIVEACLAQIPVFSTRVGIAQDICQLNIPSFTIINFGEPEQIAKQILDNLSVNGFVNTQIDDILRGENQQVIFNDMGTVLLKIISN